MNCLNMLVQIVNGLNAKAEVQQAFRLRTFIRRNAQELADLQLDPASFGLEEEQAVPGQEEQAPQQQQPDVPERPQKPVSPDIGEIQNTLLYMFVKWHSVLDRELPRFDYLGEDHIDALRSALSNVHRTLAQAVGDNKRFSKAEADEWDAEVERLVQRMHQSQKYPVNETKAKVDAFLLYRPTLDLHKKFLRITEDDPKFAEAAKEFSSLINTFANVIKNIEDIAKVDLTESR